MNGDVDDDSMVKSISSPGMHYDDFYYFAMRLKFDIYSIIYYDTICLLDFVSSISRARLLYLSLPAIFFFTYREVRMSTPLKARRQEAWRWQLFPDIGHHW